MVDRRCLVKMVREWDISGTASVSHGYADAIVISDEIWSVALSLNRGMHSASASHRAAAFLHRHTRYGVHGRFAVYFPAVTSLSHSLVREAKNHPFPNDCFTPEVGSSCRPRSKIHGDGVTLLRSSVTFVSSCVTNGNLP